MMKLPNGDSAVVDIVKLRGYCLSTRHPRGRHKAYVFARVLGITSEHAEKLRQMLLHAAQTQEAAEGRADEYGQRYTIDFPVSSGSRSAVVRSGWIVRSGEDIPRFTSCYVVEEA